MDNKPFSERIHEYFPIVALSWRLAEALAGVAVYCVIVGVVVRVADLRLPGLGAEGQLINSLIVSLLLGFRNRSAYDRWWEARRLWGQLINDCRNLACQLTAFLPADVLAASPMRTLLIGYPWALKRHLRGDGPRLREIPGFEQDVEDPDHVPAHLVERMYRQLALWRREGHLDEPALLLIGAPLRGLLDVCGGCERIRNTPLSPWYTGLLRIGIVLHLLIAPWFTMIEIGFWGIPTLLLVAFFFLGIELVDRTVEEPFGTERDDLRLEAYCETIRQNVLAIMPAEARQPEAVAG